VTVEPITLQAHKPNWALAFRAHKKVIADALGDAVVAIHHVGSTAIPGIKAKPIIDITVESSQYPPPPDVINNLSLIGFKSHGTAGVRGRYWFTKGTPREVNLHWCPIYGSVVQDQIRFRDALAADIDLAKDYEALKLSAAIGRHIDSKAYALAKANFIAQVLSN